MPSDPIRIPILRRRLAAALAGVAVLSAAGVVASTSARAETTIEFNPTTPRASVERPASPAAALPLGTAPLGAAALGGDELGVPLGISSSKLSFRLNQADKRAIKATKSINRLSTQRDTAIDASSVAQERIMAVEQLLAEAQEDEARLRTTIQQRLLEQYKEGSNADIAFLVAGGSIASMLDRGRVLRDSSARDARLFDEYQVSIDRLEQLQMVLEELRDVNGERAQLLGDRIERLGSTVAGARLAHDEVPVVADEDAPDAAEKDAKAAAAARNGTWYVMNGAFQSQLFLPNLGTLGSGSYNGGTRTPRMPATLPLVQAVMSDPRIDLDVSGKGDISTMQIDGRVLSAMKLAADQFGYIKITSLKSDHGVYTTSGNVSAHSIGCAMDIGTIGRTYITPSAQSPGGEVEMAVRFFAGLQGNLAPHQVISLFSLGGPTFAMGDHADHIHVGYSC